MNKITKTLALFCSVMLTVCAFAVTVSAKQYGDNVVSDSAKYDSSKFLAYDVNDDGYFNIKDLVRIKKAAAYTNISINRKALGIEQDAAVQATHVTLVRTQLLNK